jgi:hypothetical protein
MFGTPKLEQLMAPCPICAAEPRQFAAYASENQRRNDMLANRRLAVAKRTLAAANRPKALNDALTGARYISHSLRDEECDAPTARFVRLSQVGRRRFAHALPLWKRAQQRAGEVLSLW